jgi:hypothetical protein
MKAEWVANIRDQCHVAGVPFFFKQWGGVRQSETGRLLDGRTYDTMPERAVRKVPPHWVRLSMIEEARKWKAACEPPETTAESVKDNTERQALFF